MPAASTASPSPGAPTGSSCTTRSARSATALDDALFARLARNAMSGISPRRSRSRAKGVKAVMPGIRPLLDTLAGRADVFLALLTGNFEQSARIKLEHFDLWRYFRCGAFGDDAADRNALVPFAVERARGVRARRRSRLNRSSSSATRRTTLPAPGPCGAMPIAVATGTFSVDQLRGSGAEIVFADLSDTARCR